MSASRWARRIEQAWDGARLRRAGTPTPTDRRIESYIGHGSDQGVVVRGRVLDDPPPSEAVEGEGVGAAVRRSLRQFATGELPGVPLRVTVGGATAETTSDEEGYFTVRLPPTSLEGPWHQGVVELAGEYRGLTGPHTAAVEVLVPSRDAE